MNRQENIETCRQLFGELCWTERHAGKSARIVASKAMWLGLDKRDVLQLISTIPSASYLRKHPNVFLVAWESVSQAANPDRPPSDYMRLPNTKKHS